MPFGKYKGQNIYDLPTDYLEWAAGQCFTTALRYHIEKALFQRLNPDKAFTTKWDQNTGAEKLMEVLIKLPDQFFTQPFNLKRDSLEYDYHIRIERIEKNETSN